MDKKPSIYRPRIAGFDMAGEAAKEWQRCAESLAAHVSREEGLRVLRIGLEEAEIELAGRVKRAEARMASALKDMPPAPGEGDSQTDRLEWLREYHERTGYHGDMAVRWIDPFAFRVSIMRLFLYHMETTGDTTPPDWGFLKEDAPAASS